MSSSAPELVLPHGILWDMDGTLIDSETYWLAAETALVEQHGGIWTHEDGLTLVGQGLAHSAAVLQDVGVALEVDDIVDALTDHVMLLLSESVPWRPGALAFIREFAQLGIPQAIVTMSLRRMASLVAKQIPGQPLSAIVAGDDVARAKPDPQPYLAGAAALGVDVAHCVSFEDSVSGLESAYHAGTIAIGVPNLVEIHHAPAHDVWPSLPERSIWDAVTLYQAHRRTFDGL